MSFDSTPLKVHFLKIILALKNKFIPKFAKTALPCSCELMGPFLENLG